MHLGEALIVADEGHGQQAEGLEGGGARGVGGCEVWVEEGEEVGRDLEDAWAISRHRR